MGIALLGGLLTAVGCAPPLTQTEVKFLETRELDLPYDEAYSAAMNGIMSLGFTIDHSDKESGIVTGKRRDSQVGPKVMAGIAFGIIGILAVGDRDEAVTFMLSAVEPGVTQLRMKVVVNGKPVIDRQLMTKIWQQIEREAMLESRPSDREPATRPEEAR